MHLDQAGPASSATPIAMALGERPEGSPPRVGAPGTAQSHSPAHPSVLNPLSASREESFHVLFLLSLTRKTLHPHCPILSI